VTVVCSHKILFFSWFNDLLPDYDWVHYLGALAEVKFAASKFAVQEFARMW